jgi:hypothetical protein
MPVNTLIQLRRGTEGDWSSAPQTIGRGVLYEGEIGVVTTSGDIKLKVGDGTTPWGELCYAGVPLNSGNYIAGSGITIEYDNLCASGLWKIDENWLDNFIANSSGAINVEGVQDIIGNSGIVGGFGINKSYDDGTGFTTVSVTGMTLRVVESTGIGVSSTTESDNSVYTISVTGIDHTLITDWDAAISGDIDTQLIAGTGISFAYDSGNNTLTISTAVLDDTHTHIWDNITDAKVKASLTELGYLSGVAPGTASADRVVVLDSNKDVTGIRNLTSTSTITAVTFSGDLSGDVTSTGSSSFASVDIDGGSIDGTVIGANSAAVVSGTSIFASTGFVGDLTGNADTATEATSVTVVDNSNENASLYMTFVDGSSGTQEIETDSALRYNPSTNTLSPGNVSATGTVTADHVQTATLTTTGNVTVGGDLTVAGTTTTVNSTVVEIGDNVIRVNTSGLPTGGFEVLESGTSNYKQFVWDSVDDRWELGTENLQANRFVSTQSSPTAPLVVASTGLVTNLNSDLLDGQHGSYYLDWGNFSNFPDPVITVSLSGDVVGSDNITWTNLNGSVSLSLNTTIQPNSVALGTDTTGNYVAAVGVSGSGLTLGGSAGEGATFTVQSNATPANTADTIVSRDTSGNFSAGTITAALSGNASTATKLATARYIELTGDVTGSGLFDGSTNIQISTTVEGAGTVTLADESSDQDNYITFANDATGDEALKTNTSLRFNALNKILLGSAVGASGTPATRLEYFIVDGGSP